MDLPKKRGTFKFQKNKLLAPPPLRRVKYPRLNTSFWKSVVLCKSQEQRNSPKIPCDHNRFFYAHGNLKPMTSSRYIGLLALKLPPPCSKPRNVICLVSPEDTVCTLLPAEERVRQIRRWSLFASPFTPASVVQDERTADIPSEGNALSYLGILCLFLVQLGPKMIGCLIWNFHRMIYCATTTVTNLKFMV